MSAEINLPKSYARAKRVLSEIVMGYDTIDVCKYDCNLFWGDHANSTHSPKCGHSMWRYQDQNRKVPQKILRYFPIIPRFQRFFFFHRNVRAHPVAQGQESCREE